MVLLAPGMGDGIQAAKAGILEVGDVYVVNKADRDGADRVRRDLRTMLALGRARRGRLDAAGRSRPSPSRRGRRRASSPPSTSTARWLEASGELARRRARRARAEIEAIAVAALRARWGDRRAGTPTSTTWPPRWSAGGMDPYAAADRLLVAISS